MYVVIAGCGRVGSSLAKDLVAEGHEVGVIDEDPDAFELLGDDFEMEPRGLVEVKGKGQVETWILHGRNGSTGH